jgi:hypothetical protein
MISGTSLRTLSVTPTAAGLSVFWAAIFWVVLLATGGALVWFVQRRYAKARAAKQAKTIPSRKAGASGLTVDRAMALVIGRDRMTSRAPVGAAAARSRVESS